MKKLNLLLATTAILSTGAMTVNASESDTVNASVKLVPMKSISVIEQPNLGTWIINKDSSSSAGAPYTSLDVLSVDPSGQISSTDTTKAYIVGTVKDGKLNVSCSDIDSSVFNTDIQVLSTTQVPGAAIGTQLFDIQYKCVDGEDGKALLKLSAIKKNNMYNNFIIFMDKGGTAAGSFTVTAVYN